MQGLGEMNVPDHRRLIHASEVLRPLPTVVIVRSPHHARDNDAIHPQWVLGSVRSHENESQPAVSFEKW
jgi:hypothetical protein